MVFDNIPGSKNVPQNSSGLFDNAGVGNDIDDAALVIVRRVIERKGHCRQGLAAASRYGQ